MYIANNNRYENMKYNKVGSSGLKLPVVSLGLWHNFGIDDNFENMRNMLQTAFDNGITHFDIANVYGSKGTAETNFGKIFEMDFKQHRDELIISTKAGYEMWEGPYGNWGSRKYLLSSLDQSLERLKLEYVDIFYHHRMDPDTPLEETMGALDQAVKSGKALYAGISNYDVPTTKKAIEIMKRLNCPLIINQIKYSIFDRVVEENGFLDFAKENEFGAIIYSPLAQGLLTNKYINEIPDDSRAKKETKSLNTNNITIDIIDKVKALNEVATNRKETLAQMALKWVLNEKASTSVLIGASTSEQIIENCKIVNSKEFTIEELDLIENIINK